MIQLFYSLYEEAEILEDLYLEEIKPEPEIFFNQNDSQVTV